MRVRRNLLRGAQRAIVLLQHRNAACDIARDRDHPVRELAAPVLERPRNVAKIGVGLQAEMRCQCRRRTIERSRRTR